MTETNRDWIGSVLWALTLQFYLVQILAARDWPTPYSLANNYISDLGNTACGLYNGRSVCSPRHGLMNLSFIALGLCTTAGAYLLQNGLGRPRLGLVLIALGGLGDTLVGLAPENVSPGVHYAGAVLAFVPGNLGMVFSGFLAQRWTRALSIAAGAVGLIATVLFAAHLSLRLGMGGVERFAGYPLSLWTFAMGISLLCGRQPAPAH